MAFPDNPCAPKISSAEQPGAEEKVLDGKSGGLGSSPVMLMPINSLHSQSLGVLTFKLTLVRGTDSFHFLYQLWSGCPRHTVLRRFPRLSCGLEGKWSWLVRDSYHGYWGRIYTWRSSPGTGRPHLPHPHSRLEAAAQSSSLFLCPFFWTPALTPRLGENSPPLQCFRSQHSESNRQLRSLWTSSCGSFFLYP